jgi:hypothetical protein
MLCKDCGDTVALIGWKEKRRLLFKRTTRESIDDPENIDPY